MEETKIKIMAYRALSRLRYTTAARGHHHCVHHEDEASDGDMAEAALQQPGDDFAAAGGGSPHKDEPQARSGQHATEHCRQDLVPRKGGTNGAVTSMMTEDTTVTTAVRKVESRPRKRPGRHQTEAGSPPECRYRWQTGQIVDQRGDTGDASRSDLIGGGEDIDGQGVQDAAQQIKQAVQRSAAHTAEGRQRFHSISSFHQQ